LSIFPLTGWQQHMLAYEEGCLSKERMVKSVTLSTALLIKPQLSLRRVTQAFRKLCNRHDILRSRFHKLGGSWTCSISDSPPPGITVHDYGSAAEPEIEGLIVQHALASISLMDEASIQLDLLRFGAHGDGLVLRVHHGIADGFSLLVIIEDLVKLVLGMPLFTPALSHAAYLADWGNDTRPDSAATEAYWQRKLLPAAKPVNIGRVRRGLPMLKNMFDWSRFGSLRFDLGKADMLPLTTHARRENVSLFMLMNAAYLQAIAAAGDCDDLLYSVTLGRSDAQLSQYAGHHTLHPFMRCRGLSDMSVGAVARNANDEFVTTMAHLSSPAVRRDGWWDQNLHAAGSYPRQITTGLLNSGARARTSLFSDALSLKPGQTFNTGLYKLRRIEVPQNLGDMDELNFRPNIDGNGGTVHFSYDADAFDDAEIAELAKQVFAKVDMGQPKGYLLKSSAPQELPQALEAPR